MPSNDHETSFNPMTIQEHDYILGLAQTSCSSASTFPHNTMIINHGLLNLSHSHHHRNEIEKGDAPNDAGERAGEGSGAANADGGEAEAEDHHTDLCLGLGLPGSGRNSVKNGNTCSSSNMAKSMINTIATTSGAGAATTSFPNNGVKRGYNEAILLLGADRFHTPVPSIPDKLACDHQPTPPRTLTSKADHSHEKGDGNVGIESLKVEMAQGHGANGPPPAKDRVIGWPPIRSYRKNTLVKPSEMFVKVNMDGVTIGRKVDLNAHTSYEGLLFALEDMFLPTNLGATSQNDGKHLRLLNGSDYVLTYEDKDGDWMLVGDVPWSMFINTVKRLRIQRGTESMGIGMPLHK